MTTKPDWSLSEYFVDHEHRFDTNKRQSRVMLFSIVLLIIAAAAAAYLYFGLKGAGSAPSESSVAPAASIQSAHVDTLSEPEVLSAPDSNSGSSTVYTGSSTMQAYEHALIKAQEWKDDAVLLKASATWAQGTDRETLLDGSETWSFSLKGLMRQRIISLNQTRIPLFLIKLKHN